MDTHLPPARPIIDALAHGEARQREMPSAARVRSRQRLAWLAVAALGLALPMLVVWSVPVPPQFDGPNHLARHFLEALHLGGAALPPGYEIDYRVLPNLAADLLLPPLMWVLDPFPAWTLFLCGALLLQWLGPALFILETGERRPAAWLAALLLLPFLLSGAFLWGFLNYYLGIGFAFLAAALLVALDRRGPLPVWAMLLHAAITALLYLSHLSAVFVYGVLAGCMALMHLWEASRAGGQWAAGLLRAARLCVPLLAAVPLHLIYLANSAKDWKTVWGEPMRKLTMLFVGLFRGFDLRADLLVAVLWAGAVLAFFAPALRSRRGGPAALATLAFLGLYIVLPRDFGAASGTDARLLPALLIAGLAWLGTLPGARWSWAGMALLVAAIGAKSMDVAHGWRRLDDRLREASLALDLLPTGARVLSVSLASSLTKENPEEHYVSLAAITRQAYVPTLFAERFMQPLRLTGERSLVDLYRRYPAVRRDGDAFVLASEADAARYDHLWVFNPEGETLRLPDGWDPMFRGERVSLWRLRPSVPPAETGQAGADR